MIKLMKITCSEANEICNKSQYNEVTFIEKVKLNMHIAFCKVCALYTKQNKILTKTFKYKANDCKLHRHSLNEDEKQKLKEELKKQFNS